MRKLAEEFVDDITNKYFHRMFNAAHVNCADLDGTILGKLDHIASPTRISLKRVPHLNEFASPGTGYQLQFRRKAKIGHHVQVAALGINPHAVQTLADLPIQIDDVKVALSTMHDLPAEWLTWYGAKAIASPLLTKSTTTGLCYLFGDLCAQVISERDLAALDLGRSVRSGATGFLGLGPLEHYWLNFLDQSLSFDGASWAVVAKVALEDGPMTIVYNTLYSLLMGALALQDPRDVLDEVRATIVPGFYAAIRFWPLVDLITFSVIPIEFQVLWINGAEMIWIIILTGVRGTFATPKGVTVSGGVTVSSSRRRRQN